MPRATNYYDWDGFAWDSGPWDADVISDGWTSSPAGTGGWTLVPGPATSWS